ncbi:MAG: 5'/3'-nucleotidase SurE, partial [Treponema sp.]|nr:5'/3'-nucleotidase SurE [Treponema sp.]
MNLLLTNDDGFMAEGINVLYNVLSSEHNVYIVAPDKNRSAVSHCITVDTPLRIKKEGEHIFSCSGTPADCVLVSLRSNFLQVKFDAVVSGINRGINIGTDITYSGTCAAARQAVLSGLPGVAFSLSSSTKDFNYEALASFAQKNISHLVSLSSVSEDRHNRVFVNVNGKSGVSYKGVKFCDELSLRNYDDKCKLVQDFWGDTYSFLQ